MFDCAELTTAIARHPDDTEGALTGYAVGNSPSGTHFIPKRALT